MSSEVGTIEVVFGDDQTGQEIFLYSGQTTTVPSKLYVLLLFKSRYNAFCNIIDRVLSISVPESD